jgi:hypothetical protein
MGKMPFSIMWLLLHRPLNHRNLGIAPVGKNNSTRYSSDTSGHSAINTKIGFPPQDSEYLDPLAIPAS